MFSMSKNERLHRKFDKIRQMEESGQLRNKKQGNRTLRKLLNNRLAVFGGVIFLIIVLACIFAPLLTDYSPKMVDMKAILKAPSMEHLFGTDKIGRDIFSRVLYGGRMSIAIGFGSALGCAAIGVLLGCYSAYRGGFFDSLMVRISEIFMSIPQLILVLMLVSILGQSAKNIVIIFILDSASNAERH
jgi:peptide/nickel transport system permease protein